ncbi:cation:proton antiporter [Stappia stellulata]|uniref:cation:proton antiporter n=1 Tax=Stappia stellulata TaxID=71235 RepID=UPI0003F8B7D8|nr:cation:proton antiporter [Stappia stellulata]
MDTSLLFLTFGLLVLAGIGLDAIGRMTRLPRITLLVLFGILVGPSVLDLLPVAANGWRDPTATLTLTMIAFLLGGELSRPRLKAHGRAILAVSLAVIAASFAVMTLGLSLFGVPIALSLLLAGIALATDPAATRDVVRSARADGPVTRVLLGVVAIDDAWGVIVFSVVLGLVGIGSEGVLVALGEGIADVGGAIAVGLVIGLPASLLTGRIQPGEPTLAEALGLVLVCAGVSMWLDVSALLAGMTAGVVIVNLAKHHDRPFHEIEYVSWPFLILFFVLAGASVDLAAVVVAGPLGLAFILFRVAGRFAGGWLGGRLGGLTSAQARLFGLSLLPQAGVALGMALVGASALPAHADAIITVTVATTVVFELFGPLVTAFVLTRLGEAGAAPPEERG